MVVLLPFDKVFLCLLQPYLSVMLNKGSLEVLVFTGHHNPRRIIRRPEQGALNDGREHSLRIERLPGRLVFCVLVCANILDCCCSIKNTCLCLTLWFTFGQIFCSSGGRGGQEGVGASQQPAAELAAHLPRWDPCRSGADVQQGQRPIPGMHLEPDDQ